MPLIKVEADKFQSEMFPEILWRQRLQMYDEIYRRATLTGYASSDVLFVLRTKCDTEEVLHIRYSEVSSPIICFGSHLHRMAAAIESRDEQVYLDKCKDIKQTYDLLRTNLLAVLERVAVSHASVFSHFSLVLLEVLKMSESIKKLVEQESARVDFSATVAE